jgi:nucleotide-binding universal stress UspA family protein
MMAVLNRDLARDRRPPMTHRHREHTVVGVDGSLAARGATRWAIEHAMPGDTVELVHAWCPPPATSDVGITESEAERSADHLVGHELAHVNALAHDHGVTVSAHAVRGDPRHVLRDRPADLLVLGSDDRSSLSRALVSSVCSHFAHHGDTPVVIVPFPRTRK